LDKLDQSILAEMQKDGSISNLELADRVGLSPSPCSRRVKQLEDEGIISGYATIVDPKK
jgi:Lrp/AsnC family leucine-responsive transcriptional regulator